MASYVITEEELVNDAMGLNRPGLDRRIEEVKSTPKPAEGRIPSPPQAEKVDAKEGHLLVKVGGGWKKVCQPVPRLVPGTPLLLPELAGTQPRPSSKDPWGLSASIEEHYKISLIRDTNEEQDLLINRMINGRGGGYM